MTSSTSFQNYFAASEKTENTIFWLSSAKYLEEKKAILVEFSSGNQKRTASIAFFPSFLVSKKAISKEDLKNEISLLGNQKFTLAETETCFRVVSTNFSFLEKLANNIFASNNAIPVMPSPERQFLMEKNWGFFSAFNFSESEEIPEKNFSLPNIKTDFFSEPLPKTISELAKIDSEEANSILALVALSKILCLPLEKIPSAGFLQQEIFLENIFFKNNFAPEQLSKHDMHEIHLSQAASFFRGTPEFDLAPLIPSLLTDAVYNLGPDSINCSCCEPKTLDAKNLLPSTLVEVEFLKDAFYFESGNSCFSNAFHESNSLKENRLQRKKEFFLKQFPIGPFSRNQASQIPLPDAAVLEQDSSAKILGFKERHWHCMKQESLVSKTIKAIMEETAEANSFIEKTQRECFAGNGIMGFSEMEKNFSLRFALEYKKSLEFFLLNLPAHFCNRESRFYNPVFSSAVEAVYSNAIIAFNSIKQNPSTAGIPNERLNTYLLATAKREE